MRLRGNASAAFQHGVAKIQCPRGFWLSCEHQRYRNVDFVVDAALAVGHAPCPMIDREFGADFETCVGQFDFAGCCDFDRLI